MAGPATWGYQVLGFGAGKKPASATTTKVKVRFAEFDEDDGCACSLTPQYEVWENDPNVDFGGGDLTLSVNDWIGGYDQMLDYACVQVTEINCAESAVGYTETEYSNCDDCNEHNTICSDFGGPEGGPKGPPGGPGGPP